jgi:spermidine synthase
MSIALSPEFHLKPSVHDSAMTRALHFTTADIQSRMRLEDPFFLDLQYTRLMMGFLLFDPAPVNVAIIGLGGGSIPKFCYRHLPHTHIRVVEINPHVIAMRDAFHVPADDSRFKVVLDDGALFIRDRTHRHGILVVDGFLGHGLPSRLSSQRFYDDCRQALSPGGILVANLHSDHPQLQAQIDRVKRSFGDAILVVDDGKRGNTIVFASESTQRPDLGRPWLARTPTALDHAGANQLLGAFSIVRSAIRKQFIPILPSGC